MQLQQSASDTDGFGTSIDTQDQRLESRLPWNYVYDALGRRSRVVAPSTGEELNYEHD